MIIRLSRHAQNAAYALTLTTALFIVGCRGCEKVPDPAPEQPVVEDSAPQLGCGWFKAAAGEFTVEGFEAVRWSIEIQGLADEAGQPFGGRCALDLDERTTSYGQAAGWCINDGIGLDGRASDGFRLHVLDVLVGMGILTAEANPAVPELYDAEGWRDAVDSALPGNAEFCQVRAVVEAEPSSGDELRATVPLEVAGTPPGAEPFSECSTGSCDIDWDAWTEHVRSLEQ
jgi:hypothetical protein